MTKHEADRQKALLFQKVGIFVDAENIELSGWKHHNGRTDYKKIFDKVGDREVLRILYYKPIYKEISNTFANFWAGLGGEIRRPQKNADSFLIIDAVTLSEKIDVAIILGGDKDFLPLMWYLKSRGCRVEIWSWPEATSPEVQEQADFYFPLTKEYVILEAPSEKEAATSVSPAAAVTKSATPAVSTPAAAPSRPHPSADAKPNVGAPKPQQNRPTNQRNAPSPSRHGGTSSKPSAEGPSVQTTQQAKKR